MCTGKMPREKELWKCLGTNPVVTNLPLITASKLMNKLLDLGHLMYLPRFLPNFIYTYLHLYLPTYVPTYICTYLHLYLPTFVPTYICTYLHLYLLTCAYLPTFVPTNICTHQHLYPPTFVPTYICTYVHLYLPSWRWLSGRTRLERTPCRGARCSGRGSDFWRKVLARSIWGTVRIWTGERRVLWDLALPDCSTPSALQVWMQNQRLKMMTNWVL